MNAPQKTRALDDLSGVLKRPCVSDSRAVDPISTTYNFPDQIVPTRIFRVPASIAVFLRFPNELTAKIFNLCTQKDVLSLGSTCRALHTHIRIRYQIPLVVMRLYWGELQKLADFLGDTDDGRWAKIHTDELCIYLDDASMRHRPHSCMTKIIDLCSHYKTLRIAPISDHFSADFIAEFKLPYERNLRVLDTPFLFDFVRLHDKQTTLPVVFPTHVQYTKNTDLYKQLVFGSTTVRLFPSSTEVFLLNDQVTSSLNAVFDSSPGYTRLVMVATASNIRSAVLTTTQVPTLEEVHIVERIDGLPYTTDCTSYFPDVCDKFVELQPSVCIYTDIQPLFWLERRYTLTFKLRARMKLVFDDLPTLYWCLSTRSVRQIFSGVVTGNCKIPSDELRRMLMVASVRCPMLRDEADAYTVRAFNRDEYSGILRTIMMLLHKGCNLTDRSCEKWLRKALEKAASLQ